MAGSKAALLVATAEYGDQAFRRLRAPGHDVEALRRVLADPAIGGFDVRALVNQPGQLVEEEIEGFFADRKPDDLRCSGSPPRGSPRPSSTSRWPTAAPSGSCSCWTAATAGRSRGGSRPGAARG